jgi:hypothetical protein
MPIERAKAAPIVQSVHSTCHEPIDILGIESAPMGADGKLDKNAGESCGARTALY